MMIGKVKVEWTDVFKYAVVLLIIVYVIMLMQRTGGTTKSYETIEESVISAIDQETLAEVNELGFKKSYGLAESDYDGVLLYSSTSSMQADEVLLVKVKSADQMNTVQGAVEEHVESRLNDFEGYAPDQVELLDNHVMVIRGDYLFFAVSADAEQYREAFVNSL